MKYYVSGHVQSGIYKITNKINKKYYIGSACDLYKRYKEHNSALISNRHHNKQLTRFVNKYGIDNLEFDLLEECPIERLELREQYYISNNKNLFNETVDVKACNRGKKLSEEHKQRISESIKVKGIKRSKETKQKMSDAKIGNKINLGRVQSEETKKKISNNIERNQKISKALKGRIVNWIKHSDETKQKIREKNKNNNNCKKIIQLDLKNNIIKEWSSIAEASRYYSYISNYGSIRSSLNSCLKGKTKTSLKFKWKYKK
jgi:group I intron endonuclease